MSHIVTIQTKVHDPWAVAAACQRLGLPAQVQGIAKLFSGDARDLLVQLPDWQYPAAIDTLSGTLHYDYCGGAWGDPAHLNLFVQRCAVEKAKIEARQRGYTVTEQTLSDGSIKVQLIERGG